MDCFSLLLSPPIHGYSLRVVYKLISRKYMHDNKYRCICIYSYIMLLQNYNNHNKNVRIYNFICIELALANIVMLHWPVHSSSSSHAYTNKPRAIA